MRILVSNDDGIMAPGIQALIKAMEPFGEVYVIAPDRNRSGASNSLTLTSPLRVKKVDSNRYCIEGTPTDCVHLGVTGFFEEKMDIVVSGMNHGGNLGDDILYSGTVAAAMEGRNLGLPAMSFSMVGDDIQYFETGAHIAKKLLSEVIKQTIPSQTILNVNIPDLPIDKIKGIQITRLGKRHAASPVIKSIDPRGKPIYWIGPPGNEADGGVGTDFYAVNNGFVSVTPLHLDLTNYSIFSNLSDWLLSP
jgi:5'-nucleotidase